MLLVWFYNLTHQIPFLVHKQYNTFNLPVDHLIDWYLIFI